MSLQADVLIVVSTPFEISAGPGAIVALGFVKKSPILPLGRIETVIYTPIKGEFFNEIGWNPPFG